MGMFGKFEMSKQTIIVVAFASVAVFAAYWFLRNRSPNVKGYSVQGEYQGRTYDFDFAQATV
jgi:hypothetical protein